MNKARMLAGATLLASAATASAHVSYTGRDFIANDAVSGDGAVYTLAGQTVRSNYGWADAADGDWGDSHRGRFLKFTLDQESFVTIAVAAQSGSSSTLADLVPAFSVYGGLVPQLSHEGSQATDFLANHPGLLPTSPYYNGHPGDKEGAWRALSDFWMGSGDLPGEGAAAKITYIGHAFDGAGVDVSGDRVSDLEGDGTADGQVSATFRLAAGTYTVTVGGACYACQYTEGVATWQSNRAFTASITLAPVPEPATWALTAAGLGIVASVRARRRGAR